MKITRWLFPVGMVLLLGACENKPGYHVEEYKEIKIEELSDDIKIPSKVWDLMEFKGSEHGAAPAAGGHGEAPAAGESSGKNLIFSEVSVFLVQKNEGIVEGEAIKISLPKGGGPIDLSRYITGQKGSFYVGFEFPQFEGALAKKVVFVSNTRKRKIGNQIFGAGCNQILDITDKFLLEMKGEGLKLNTTQERYVSVIGGSFLFAAQKENDVYLAQVTFKNPQYQPLFCEER